MKKNGNEAKAGHLLAEGLDCRSIEDRLQVGEDKLVSWIRSEPLREAYGQSVRLKEMMNYAMALDRLKQQMQNENTAIALKAVHEVLSHTGKEKDEDKLTIRLLECEENEGK